MKDLLFKNAVDRIMGLTEMWSPWYIYLKNLKAKHIYAKIDNASFLCQDEIQISSNRAKTSNKDFQLGNPK